jgi:hypothetical protein
MTILNGIEIDNITYETNTNKLAILNNTPIDNILHVIIVISNPCLYAKRYILAKQFIRRFDIEENIKLYVVELAYKNNNFYITDEKNKNHLRIRTISNEIWHKENLINMGIKLLPSNWKAFAWIDADIEFDNSNWALDTLKILNGYKDVVQLYSHAIDMDNNEKTMNVFTSFGYQYHYKKPYIISKDITNYWHPGFAWAMTRKLYDKIGSIYDVSILGSGDNNMALSFIGKGLTSVNEKATDGYKQSILDFENKCKNVRLGYVPGVIKHYYHGSKANRKYNDRWKILINYNYDPFIHITKNKEGLIIPTKDCPKKLLEDIFNYFKERNEDEI